MNQDPEHTMERAADRIRSLVFMARTRWAAVMLSQATARAALTAAGVLVIALWLAGIADGHPHVVTAIAAGAVVAVGVGVVQPFLRLRHWPTDARVSRFIEEQTPWLEDRLVSAVEILARGKAHPSPLAGPIVADAASRAGAVDLDRVVSIARVGRSSIGAIAALSLVAAILFAGRTTARQALDAVLLTAFPAHISLQVTPGNARVIDGQPLAIEARLVGTRATVGVQLEVSDGDHTRPLNMARNDGGRYRFEVQSVTEPFRYRILAGPRTSPMYDVTVVPLPRVVRIDIEYTYPRELRLSPRAEDDAGDIYAPVGTDIRLRVHTNRPVVSGRLTLGRGGVLSLSAEEPTRLAGGLRVTGDDEYRVAVADRDGVSSAGDVEYFIRTFADRPPAVHIVKPAVDRSVTQLEEVDIEAQADDDYGIERMDLVYAIRGGSDRIVPLSIPRRAPSVAARHVLRLEDLNVKPGDFVSYYVRASDVTRGRRSSEAKSDIFFLQVRPFEQEFTLAESQATASDESTSSLDELIDAQKQVVVATWKLDRRGEDVKTAPQADIRLLSRTERELKTRVEQTSSSFREGVMRTPPRRGARGPSGDPDGLKAGETLAEEDAMTAAAAAMGRAIVELDALKTRSALPPEMEALSHLVKAQAELKRRHIARQAGSNRGATGNVDISMLFDQELKRAQQTNYETPANRESQKRDEELLQRVKELAARQDELLKHQADLARSNEQANSEERRRELERLTREQVELEQLTEQLARRTEKREQPQDGSERPEQGSGTTSGEAETGERLGRRLHEASEAMRNAAGDLRRRDPGQASARGSRALETLRDLERQLQASSGQSPSDRQRALGDAELESREIADAERQIAAELKSTGRGDGAKDALRRLAGRQDQVTERAKRLEESLKRQAVGPPAAGSRSGGERAQRLPPEAAREVAGLGRRLKRSADAMRAAAIGTPPQDTGTPGAAEQAIARALDTLADTMASAREPVDAGARRLADQLTRTQQLKERLDRLAQEIEQLAGNEATNGGARGGRPDAAQKGTDSQAGSPAPGDGAGQQGGVALAERREEYARQALEAQRLLERVQREDPTQSRGTGGTTFVNPGPMVRSAPGTEAFKQDFARWEALRQHVTEALERAETSLSKQLGTLHAKSRLTSGGADTAPSAYQPAVDNYFKALATKKP